MKKTFDDIPGWAFEIDEISAGMYEVVGRDLIGNYVRITGIDPYRILEKCKIKAIDIIGSYRDKLQS